jgi:hypothetical protein
VFAQNLKKGEIMTGVQIKGKMNELVAFGCSRECERECAVRWDLANMGQDVEA